MFLSLLSCIGASAPLWHYCFCRITVKASFLVRTFFEALLMLQNITEKAKTKEKGCTINVLLWAGATLRILDTTSRLAIPKYCPSRFTGSIKNCASYSTLYTNNTVAFCHQICVGPDSYLLQFLDILFVISFNYSLLGRQCCFILLIIIAMYRNTCVPV